MIEFRGRLTGAAERHFHKKSNTLAQNLFLFSMILLSPLLLPITWLLGNYLVVYVYCVIFVVIPLVVRIPKGKKEKLELTPKRVYIEGSQIVCIADRYEEIRNINDVRRVYDYGEFYDITFPFGKISEKFICQKELLTRGSLNKFEKVFKEKIVRKI